MELWSRIRKITDIINHTFTNLKDEEGLQELINWMRQNIMLEGLKNEIPTGVLNIDMMEKRHKTVPIKVYHKDALKVTTNIFG